MEALHQPTCEPQLSIPVVRRIRWVRRGNTGWVPFVESLFVPPVDLYESGAHVVVKVDLPGVRRTNLELSVEEGTRLALRGERSADETRETRYIGCERPVGRFGRTIELPAPVDASSAKAALREGVLEIVLPKRGTAAYHTVTVTVT